MFKKIAFILFVAAAAITSCKNSQTSKCPDLVCDASFSAIPIRFLDKNGDGQPIKNFSAVNQRTKDTIKSTFSVADIAVGSYFVIDDSYTKKLSDTGDDIKVSGTDSASNVTKTAIVKVKGGECACHVTKVSGPDAIQFE